MRRWRAKADAGKGRRGANAATLGASVTSIRENLGVVCRDHGAFRDGAGAKCGSVGTFGGRSTAQITPTSAREVSAATRIRLATARFPAVTAFFRRDRTSNRASASTSPVDRCAISVSGTARNASPGPVPRTRNPRFAVRRTFTTVCRALCLALRPKSVACGPASAAIEQKSINQKSDWSKRRRKKGGVPRQKVGTSPNKFGVRHFLRRSRRPTASRADQKGRRAAVQVPRVTQKVRRAAVSVPRMTPKAWRPTRRRAGSSIALDALRPLR